MDFQEIIVNLLSALAPIAASFLVLLLRHVADYFRQKAAGAASETMAQTVAQYLYLLEQIVARTVDATNQMFVEQLKREGKFDKEAQNRIKNQVIDEVKDQLGLAKIELLQELLGNLDVLIGNLIEARIRSEKNAPHYVNHAQY